MYNFEDIAASYQEAIVDTLIAKFDKALNEFSVNSGIICGGVAANKRLREKLDRLDKNIIYPSMKYCTDNADMIAFLAQHKIENNKINFDKNSLSDQQVEKLIAVAKGCPVAQSLNSDLIQEVIYNF